MSEPQPWLRRVAAALDGYVLAFLPSALVWDLVAAAVGVPAWWHAFSYVALALAVAAGCLAVLLRTLLSPAGARAPRRSALQLAGLGLLLLAWLLRGHAEIPPELPLIAAQLAGALLYVAALRRRVAGGRAARHSP